MEILVLSTIEKSRNLSLIASDCPVQTGLEEILCLGQKIKQMVKEVELSCYCYLAICRELFMLCRISVQSMLDTNAEPVQNILGLQVSHGESVMKILHKPTRKNVSLYYKFKQRHWPLEHF